jgi:hypothetical protein
MQIASFPFSASQPCAELGRNEVIHIAVANDDKSTGSEPYIFADSVTGRLQ